MRSSGLVHFWRVSALAGFATVLGCSGEVDGAPTFPEPDPPAPVEDNVTQPAVNPLEPAPPNESTSSGNGAGVEEGASDPTDEDIDDDDDDRDDDQDDDEGDIDEDDADGQLGSEPGLDDVTFTNDVRAILVAQCGRCHAAGNLPNFASADPEAAYDVAAREGREILEELSEGAMPLDTCRGGAPGDAGCVSVAEFETIVAWVNADVPE